MKLIKLGLVVAGLVEDVAEEVLAAHLAVRDRAVGQRVLDAKPMVRTAVKQPAAAKRVV